MVAANRGLDEAISIGLACAVVRSKPSSGVGISVRPFVPVDLGEAEGDRVRTVLLPGTDIVTSVIGMGCASLGSRVSPACGRRRLDAAFDQGVTWYDVAPSYGAGRAETILAPFLAPRRDKVFICSKVGLASPRHNGAIRLVYALGRPVLGLAHGARRRFRAIPATRSVRIPLTPALIETSISASLTRLGTGYLDVFALHDPDPADLAREEILRVLENVRSRGLARHISVAGTPAAAVAAQAAPLFGFFQLADDPTARPVSRLYQTLDRPAAFITHSVFGVGGARDRLVERLKSDPQLARAFAAAGYDGTPETSAATVLMRRALAANPDGVVLASMFSGSHLTDNVGLANLPVDPSALDLCEKAFSTDGAWSPDGLAAEARA